jgi:hypothetical protein
MADLSAPTFSTASGVELACNFPTSRMWERIPSRPFPFPNDLAADGGGIGLVPVTQTDPRLDSELG